MQDQVQDRASFLRAAGGVALAGVSLARAPHARAARAAAAAGAPPVLTPDQALRRLMAGNARFASGRLRGGNGIAGRRADVAGGQTPFAVVLTCADSRVAPEYVFDQRLGDIFVCRVAGNILDPGILGSIEYAVAHFHSTAVVVLGHQRCGAVTDTVELVETRGSAPGSIEKIVDAIRPAVAATRRGSLSHRDYVEAVIRTNARLVARAMPARSRSLRSAIGAGRLRVVPGHYSLDSGRVTLLA
jgi:carbonic anhydrase